MGIKDKLAWHEAWFASYTEGFLERAKNGQGGQGGQGGQDGQDGQGGQGPTGDIGPFLLKIEHTAKVLANAKTIVASQDFMDQLGAIEDGVHRADIIHACHLAALYHDVGRFPQYRDYGTFADALSVNHAIVSARTLAREGILQGEHHAVRRLVIGAVALHNRYILPNTITDTLRIVTDVVRDADKLDIVRIMAPQLSFASLEEAKKQANKDGHNVVTMHVKDEPELWSEAVVKDALAGRVAKYTDMRYINDFRIVMGTWIQEFRFPASLERLAMSGLMHDIFAGLPQNDVMSELTAYLLEPLTPFVGEKTLR
ncbi:MAG: HD domain-containing protein [Pseudomonadota bacterium]